LNVPTRGDIDTLNTKVTELTAKVEKLKKNMA
jgi:outer membrane murein-binding lipoprotein Lpp